MTVEGAPFYALEAMDITKKPFPFSQLQDKVVLVVNTASKCGFTPQYSGLEELYQKHKDQGLVVIGFPCDQFGGQEPDDEVVIGQFCEARFGVTFPLMAKIEVNGDNTHPVYSYLKHEKKQMFMEKIKWNFEKFLVDRNGQVVKRFSSVADPMTHIEPEVSKLL